MAYNSAYTGPQVDAAVGAVQNKESTWDGKQDKLTGQSGQVVGFNEEGNAVAQTPPETGDVKADGSVPMTGDLNMGGHRITNVSAPTQPTDAVRQSDLKTVSDEVDGIISGATPIILPPATTTKIGGVIVGDGIEVEADGTISTNPVPAGGTPGQVLTKTETGEAWQDGGFLPLSGGTVNGYINFDQAKSGIYFSKFQDEHNCYPTIRSTTIDGKVALSIYTKAHNGVNNTVYPIILSGVDTPKKSHDAANKAYVDSKSPTSIAITLTTSGWSSNTQTVTVSGVSASETAQLITPTPAIASQSAYYEAGIMCTNQGTNSLTFTCQTVPTSNLTVYVVIQPLG